MEKKQPFILLLETATSICSVALIQGNNLIGQQEAHIANVHSARLSLLIDDLIKEAGITYKDLSAVAVSCGPGSYTGLRIGVSTAKGICYGLNVPLISVKTLEILCQAALEKYPSCQILAMIDARRMEVYSAIYNNEMQEIKPLSADILTIEIYDQYFDRVKQTIVVGDAQQKAQQVFAGKENLVFDSSIYLQAKYMTSLAWAKYKAQQFESVAYFEPYYLKDFVAAKSKVKGLYSK